MFCRSTVCLAAALTVCLPTATLAFSPAPGWVRSMSTTSAISTNSDNTSSSSSSRRTILFADGDDEEEAPGLLFGDALKDELSQFKSKYPTAEADYLAAARQRSDAKMESVNSESTAEEWQAVAREKKQEGLVVDDWENSMAEAGNADSQILIPVMHDEDSGEDGEDGPEPTLLLF